MTKRLSVDAFDSAKRYLESHARSLDVARFKIHFQAASPDPMISALHAYRNPDGGFGQALEPDLRAKDSSALCTTIAFQILREIETEPEEPLIRSSLAYLVETLNRDTGHWRIIPSSAEASPHAPWWSQTGHESILDEFSFNPTAEILGYLFDYREMVPEEIISLVNERVKAQLAGTVEIEMHELLCCLRLFETETLPEDTRDLVRRKVERAISSTVELDLAKWEGYSLRPLQMITSPASPFLTGSEEAVAANLDYEIISQREDGSWQPTWSWGDEYPDDWKRAKMEWSGIITLEKLLILKEFNRIEGL